MGLLLRLCSHWGYYDLTVVRVHIFILFNVVIGFISLEAGLEMGFSGHVFEDALNCSAGVRSRDVPANRGFHSTLSMCANSLKRQYLMGVL